MEIKRTYNTMMTKELIMEIIMGHKLMGLSMKMQKQRRKRKRRRKQKMELLT